jgi:DNA-binding CsgD family transcriptional regulator
MKQSAAAADIRQLCSLGPGGKAVMPEPFRTPHEAIPSHLNAFFYADCNGELADIYSEYRTDGLPGIAECMRTRLGVEADETVFAEEELFRSDYYNLIFRPQGIHIPLQSAAGDRSGRALGAMLIYRGQRDPNYTPEEMRLMASFLPHIAHGMQSRPDLSDAAAGSEDRGLLIVQPPSHVLHVSPQARTLVHFALDRTPDTKGERGVDAGLAPVLTRLRTNLRDTFGGRPSPPPTTSLKSPWGLFILHAYWLESLQPQEDGLVGVTIERHEPLSLRLLRNMRASGLTARQRQLCLLLFDGMSIPATAKRLNVSQHTIVDHLKKVYLKLDVHNRDELRSKLEGG